MSIETLRIGRIVEAKIKEIGMSKAEFGRRMNTSRQNVNTLLKKRDMGIITLFYACRAVNTNFYLELQKLLPKEIQGSVAAPYQKNDTIRVQIELESPDDLIEFEKWWRGRKG